MGGNTVRTACDEAPPYEAVIVTASFAATVLAETVNVAEVPADGMVTVARTVAAVELEDSVTAGPPAGGGCERATVPVTVPPLATEVAERVRPCTTGGEGCTTTAIAVAGT